MKPKTHSNTIYNDNNINNLHFNINNKKVDMKQTVILSNDDNDYTNDIDDELLGVEYEGDLPSDNDIDNAEKKHKNNQYIQPNMTQNNNINRSKSTNDINCREHPYAMRLRYATKAELKDNINLNMEEYRKNTM